MLVLTRRIGEGIVIDEGIRVTVAGVQGSRVRLNISAPPSVRVDRQEVHERRVLEEQCGGADGDTFVWGARGRVTTDVESLDTEIATEIANDV
jgi:carbon storage regulator CsrA